MSEKDFLTVADVARELGLTVRTVRRLFSTGKLQGKKIAGKYIITRDALKRYIDAAQWQKSPARLRVRGIDKPACGRYTEHRKGCCR